jgi:hypothetical protein
MEIRLQSLGRLLASVVLAGIVAACGGGGGSSAPNTTVKSATLVGAQENPAVTTAATGTAFFTVDLDSGAISGSATTFGITGSAAHIHEAAVGVNGPIIVPLTEGPTGTWSTPEGALLTATQLESFRAGNLYVNVHTAANPGGEIRGQIGRQVFYATLTGTQETPPVTTAATGVGRFVFNPDTRALSGTVNTTGVTGTAAHLHTAAIGVAGPVTIPLNGGPSDWSVPAGTVLTESQASALTGGLLYANVHSAVNPGGEIRGQLFPPSARATLSGVQETPPNASTASGVGRMMVNPFTKATAVRIQSDLTAATAAHVHRAPAGVAGGIVIPLTSTSPGVWVSTAGATVTDELLIAFMKGELYLNVHSAAFPGGEIRGQLLPTQ